MTPPLPPHLTAAELTVLARSPDRAVRSQVAAHPNTPANVLAELAPHFAAEVLANPALPLLRLANPQLLQGWSVRALEQLAAQPSAPDWLLRVAARHPIIDVQLAAVVHPDLPDDVPETLSQSPFWTIREYVSRKPVLPDGVRERLTSDADYGVRLSMAGRDDLTPQQTAKLRADTHPLVRSVLTLRERMEEEKPV